MAANQPATPPAQQTQGFMGGMPLGLPINISNILQLLGSLSTILLTFFMLMLTLMNQNFKGVVYIAGAMFAYIIGIMLGHMFQGQNPANPPNPRCNIIGIPVLTANNIPAKSSLFIMFTFAYLLLPMQYNKQMNYGVIVGILSLFGADTVSKLINNCTTVMGIIFGSLIGFMLGAIWYSILHGWGADGLLYFNEMDSNATQCSMPDKQTFKCSVYKNGELIGSNIA